MKTIRIIVLRKIVACHTFKSLFYYLSHYYFFFSISTIEIIYFRGQIKLNVSHNLDTMEYLVQ